MREVLQQLVAAIECGTDVAFCQLIETRGSTPQKAGAAMLVRVDGSQAGTLGGGCVESEVRQRALRNLAARTATIETFTLDHDYGWDDGLICGGRMSVLVAPLLSAADQIYFRRLHERCEGSQPTIQVIALDGARYEVPPGASALFSPDSQLLAERPANVGAAFASTSAVVLQTLNHRSRPQTHHGLCFVPLHGRCRLLIIGGGHVGRAVASLASAVDFDVSVYDDRADMVTTERFPTAIERISGEIDQVLPTINITPDTYCLIVTRGHHHDEEALFHVAERGARYVGLIGSRRKIRMIFDDLRQEGISNGALDAVFAPVGIDIGSQTVDEIAVSIVAELIAHRNCGGIVPGRPRTE